MYLDDLSSSFCTVSHSLQRCLILNISCKFINKEDTELIAQLCKDCSPFIHIMAPYVEQYSEDGIIGTAVLAPYHANRRIIAMVGAIVDLSWSRMTWIVFQVFYFLYWYLTGS